MLETAPVDTLIQRLKDGDENAFVELYRRWQPPLFRFAYRMTGSSGLAEDAVQEVFLAVIQRLDRYDPTRGPIGPYLYGMARNHVLRRLERERPYLQLVEGAEDRFREPEEDAQAGLLRREQNEALRTGILSLPAHYREAIVLCDLQLLSYEDAAASIGCAVGTLRSRLHRGRSILAERLRTRDASPAHATFLKHGGALS